MSDIEKTNVYAGMTTEGIGGIDGEFMAENELLLTIVVTMHGEAGIMLHPQFNFESAPNVIKMLDVLHAQSVEVLQGTSGGNGQVH